GRALANLYFLRRQHLLPPRAARSVTPGRAGRVPRGSRPHEGYQLPSRHAPPIEVEDALANGLNTATSSELPELTTGRCLGPGLGIMAVDHPRPRVAEATQAGERREHRFPIVGARGQMQGLERASEVAGIGREHDLAAIESHPERLMAGRVAVRRD